MIGKKTQLLTIATAFLIQLGVQANDTPVELEYQQVLPTRNPIVLDGDISDEEWGHAPEIHNPEFYIPKGSGDTGTRVIFEEYNGGTWEGEADHSTFTKFLYDGENLFISLLVVDDFHEHAGVHAFEGDSAQIMIANSDRDAQIALYNFGLNGVQSDPNFFPVCGQTGVDPCNIHHEAGPSSIDEINAAIVRGEGVTSYEIMLSAASLGIEETLEPGIELGFGVTVNDGDEATPGQRGWGGLGAHSIVFGKTPAETVVLVFDQDVVVEPWPGDVNGDGHTDVADLNIIGTNWRMSGKTYEQGDLTGDGNVDSADLNILALNWQTWAPMPATVPEPSTVTLVLTALLGCFGTLRKHRR